VVIPIKHYGDITLLHGDAIEPVDIITGGSPCQDLSVAGKRAGLSGERSGLFMEQIRVVKEMRERDRKNGRADVDIRPRFMVWENVPGALSSNNGEDFRVVLEEICRIKDKTADVPRPQKGKWQPSGCIVGDGFSVAWRIHDAQFWGVPQRRRRIALVADFASEFGASEILFERESVSGNTGESREEMQDTTTATTESTGKSGKALSFQERAGKPGGGKGILIQNDRTGALSTLNRQAVCYGISSYDSNAMKSSNPKSGVYVADTSRTLDNNGGNPSCNQGGVAVVAIEGNGSRPSHRGDGYSEKDVSFTLNSTEIHAVAISGADMYNGNLTGGVSMTLTAIKTDPHHVPCVVKEENDAGIQ